MTRQSTHAGHSPRHVSLVALPDGVASTLFGVFDAMNAFSVMDVPNVGPQSRPFQVDIVGEAEGSVRVASGVPIHVQRPVDAIETSDIVIVPSLVVRSEGWKKGRYPRLVDWLRAMHERGAMICSACSGIFLLAETGLFDGKDATVHFAYARAFTTAYPAVAIHPERALGDLRATPGERIARRTPSRGRADEMPIVRRRDGTTSSGLRTCASIARRCGCCEPMADFRR